MQVLLDPSPYWWAAAAAAVGVYTVLCTQIRWQAYSPCLLSLSLCFDISDLNLFDEEEIVNGWCFTLWNNGKQLRSSKYVLYLCSVFKHKQVHTSSTHLQTESKQSVVSSTNFVRLNEGIIRAWASKPTYSYSYIYAICVHCANQTTAWIERNGAVDKFMQHLNCISLQKCLIICYSSSWRRALSLN